MHLGKPPNLDDLVYQPQDFHYLYESDLGRRCWNFLKRPDNLIRMETAAFFDKATVEPLAPFLLEKFGTSATEFPVNEMIKHMVCQIMEAMGSNCDSSTFVIKKNETHLNEWDNPELENDHAKKVEISSEQRDAWPKNVENDLFDRWLNRRIRNEDDKFDLNQLYRIAREHGIEDRYEHFDPDQQRMIITNKLRKMVPEREIILDEEASYERGLSRLNDADWDALYEALDRPVMPKPRLAKLLAEKVYSFDLG